MARAAIPGDGNLEGFVADTLKRAGLMSSSSSSSSGSSGRLEVDNEGVVVQANAVVIPCRIVKDGGDGDGDGDGARGVKHLVVKHVDIGGVSYRDDEHRERTRASYARECAFYRSCGKSMSSSTGAADAAAVATAHLVEGDDTSDVFTLVMDDARFVNGGGGGGGGDHVTGGTSPSPSPSPLSAPGGMGMSLAEAEAAVEWLASFHAKFWRGLPSSSSSSSSSSAVASSSSAAVPTPKLPEAVSRTPGGYWTLEKRTGDLDGMEDEWDKLLAAFPGEATLEAHRGLAARLRRAAPAISRATRRGAGGAGADGGGGGGGGGGETLIHGDFKQANIITPSSSSSSSSSRKAPVVVIDWQSLLHHSPHHYIYIVYRYTKHPGSFHRLPFVPDSLRHPKRASCFKGASHPTPPHPNSPDTQRSKTAYTPRVHTHTRARARAYEPLNTRRDASDPYVNE